MNKSQKTNKFWEVKAAADNQAAELILYGDLSDGRVFYPLACFAGRRER
ncbi:MAG: hypothetical protein FWH05_08675 [Oscillospiraceae bacterium]|nr:hypothetical protein [Oscillospiraceae bacterium]